MIPDTLDSYVILCESMETGNPVIYATYPSLSEATESFNELKKFHESCAERHENGEDLSEEEWKKMELHPTGIWKFTRVI